MKQLSKDIKEQKVAKIPHEVFTFNIIIVHIFFSVAIMKFANFNYLFLPILLSLLIIIWTYFRTKKVKQTKSFFVYLHWQYSLNWYRPIIFVYTISIVIYILGMFIASNSEANMQEIINTIFTLLSLVPLFFTILTAFVVESGMMFNAGRGEVPEKFIAKYSKIKESN